jgi:hypothetical protein
VERAPSGRADETVSLPPLNRKKGVELTTVLRHPLVQPFRAAGRTVVCQRGSCLCCYNSSIAGRQKSPATPGSARTQEGHREAQGMTSLLEPTKISAADLRLPQAGRAEVSAEARTLVEMAFLDHVARRWSARLAGRRPSQAGPVQLLRAVPIGRPLTKAAEVQAGGRTMWRSAAIPPPAGVGEPLVIGVNRGWTHDDWTSIARLSPESATVLGSGGGPRPPARIGARCRTRQSSRRGSTTGQPGARARIADGVVSRPTGSADSFLPDGH